MFYSMSPIDWECQNEIMRVGRGTIFFDKTARPGREVISKVSVYWKRLYFSVSSVDSNK